MKSNSSAPCDKAEDRPFTDTRGEINTEDDYNSASSQLADELLRENTAQELALALAHHLIYVNELQAVILEQRCLMQEQENARARREDLIVEQSLQVATKTATKTATQAAIMLRRNLMKANASKAAKAMHDRSTRAAEKEIMRECWKERQANSGRYRFKTDFAGDMIDKFPDWKNSKVIEQFCRDWEKQEE